jgi:hypothetical protein
MIRSPTQRNPVGRQDVETPPSLCERAQGLESVREINVVSIQNGHEIAGGRSSGGVLGGGLPAVLLPQEHDRVAARLDRSFEIVG